MLDSITTSQWCQVSSFYFMFIHCKARVVIEYGARRITLNDFYSVDQDS